MPIVLRPPSKLKSGPSDPSEPIQIRASLKVLIKYYSTAVHFILCVVFRRHRVEPVDLSAISLRP